MLIKLIRPILISSFCLLFFCACSMKEKSGMETHTGYADKKSSCCGSGGSCCADKKMEGKKMGKACSGCNKKHCSKKSCDSKGAYQCKKTECVAGGSCSCKKHKH